MKTIISFITILITGALFNLFLPWYGLAIVAFLVALAVTDKASSAFLSGFAAGFMLWLFTALTKTWGNEGILVSRMSELIGVSGFLLYLITALIGAFVAGFSALSGYFFKGVFIKKDDGVYLKVK
jgi:hypothetical protein